VKGLCRWPEIVPQPPFGRRHVEAYAIGVVMENCAAHEELAKPEQQPLLDVSQPVGIPD
jgi:hypothetical protein